MTPPPQERSPARQALLEARGEEVVQALMREGFNVGEATFALGYAATRAAFMPGPGAGVGEPRAACARGSPCQQPAHKCSPIAVICNTDTPSKPGESDGGKRFWWVGELLEPIPGWPRERYCLHVQTPLKQVVFCFDGDPDASMFEALAVVLRGGQAKLGPNVKRDPTAWDEYLLKNSRSMAGVFGAPAGQALPFKVAEERRCRTCGTLRPFLDTRTGCSRCGYHLTMPHALPEGSYEETVCANCAVPIWQPDAQAHPGLWLHPAEKSGQLDGETLQVLCAHAGPERAGAESVAKPKKRTREASCANGCGAKVVGYGWDPWSVMGEACPKAATPEQRAEWHCPTDCALNTVHYHGDALSPRVVSA